MKTIYMITLFYIISDSQAEPYQKSDFLLNVDRDFFIAEPKLSWGLDPFEKAPGYAELITKEEKFVLTGVMYSQKLPVAMINGVSVREGEIIEGRIVEEIGENYAVLRKGGSLLEISIAIPVDPREEDLK
jgi:hypothetical protein